MVRAVTPAALPPLRWDQAEQEESSTQVYRQPDIDGVVAALLATGEGKDDVSPETANMPYSDIEALLRNLDVDGASPGDASPGEASPREALAAGVEVEVSSITYEELEAFRRELRDPATESQWPPPAQSVLGLVTSIFQWPVYLYRKVWSFIGGSSPASSQRTSEEQISGD